MRIIGFRGYRDGKGVLIKGQLISQDYQAPKREASRWQNLKANVARLLARGVGGVKVTVTMGEQRRETKTDKQGFFHARFTTDLRGWQRATISAQGQEETVQALCDTSLPGIISDVDDTFLTTHTAHLFKKIWLLLSRNAKTREAVKGMPAFYRATRRQAFYVSSSSWELYDLIKDFCEEQEMPKGPYLLSEERLSTLRRDHHDKERRIRDILRGYDTTFILVGDDAQRDPHIYKAIAKAYPEKIEAVFIRATKDPDITREILKGCKTPCFVEGSAQDIYERYKEMTRKKT